jgi:hypothetical protein
MDTFKFILTFLLAAMINNVVLYFWSRKTQKTPSMHLQIDSEQNETDAERETPRSPASDSRNASEDGQVTTTEITTALVRCGESATSCTPHVFNAQPPLRASPSTPLPAPTLIGSYHEIVSAITRYVQA